MISLRNLAAAARCAFVCFTALALAALYLATQSGLLRWP